MDTIRCAQLAVLAAVSCNESPKSPFTRSVADYAVVTIEAPDLSGITDNGKEVLNLYRFAADGSLEAVWHHDAYKERIDKIGNYMKAAA